MRLAFLIVFISLFLGGCLTSEYYYQGPHGKRAKPVPDFKPKIISTISRAEKERYERQKNAEKQNIERKKKEKIALDKEKEAKLIIKKEKEIFENAKVECEEIGFKKGTEKFGECVLDLTE